MEVQSVLVFLLQGVVIASVLALGLKARAADVLYLRHRPGLLLRSFLAMYVVTPLIAVLLLLLLNLPPGHSLGLVLVAISAGAPLLPKTMLKLGCNPPYVYSLLVGTTLAAVLTVPCSLAVLSPLLPEHTRESPLSVAAVVARTFVVPLAVGVLLRHLAPLTADRIHRPVLLVSGLLLATVLLSLLVLNFSAVLEFDLLSLGAIVILTFAGLAVGHLLGGPEPGNRTCLALASSTRHLGLAAVIAVATFSEARPLPTVLVFMLVSIVAMVLYGHVRKKQPAAAPGEREVDKQP
jgi:BASS family bile acid:Na+ symporter